MRLIGSTGDDACLPERRDIGRVGASPRNEAVAEIEVPRGSQGSPPGDPELESGTTNPSLQRDASGVVPRAYPFQRVRPQLVSSRGTTQPQATAVGCSAQCSTRTFSVIESIGTSPYGLIRWVTVQTSHAHYPVV